MLPSHEPLRKEPEIVSDVPHLFVEDELTSTMNTPKNIKVSWLEGIPLEALAILAAERTRMLDMYTLTHSNEFI